MSWRYGLVELRGSRSGFIPRWPYCAELTPDMLPAPGSLYSSGIVRHLNQMVFAVRSFASHTKA